MCGWAVLTYDCLCNLGGLLMVVGLGSTFQGLFFFLFAEDV